MLLVPMLCAACASAPEPVRVTVSGRLSVSASVTFFEGDDSPAAAELRMGAWESGVGPGGRVVVRGTSCFTPSSCTSESAAIAGLQPGDELLIDGSTKPVPPDCVVTSTELANEQGGSSWVDPDPQSIDARLIHWSTGSASIPFGGATNGNDVDNEQVAFVPLQNNDGTGGRPPSTVSVSVVKCAETDYDDLRPLLAP